MEALISLFDWLTRLHWWYGTLPEWLVWFLATLPIVLIGVISFWFSSKAGYGSCLYLGISTTLLFLGFLLLPYNMVSYCLCALVLTFPFWGGIIDLY